MSMSGRKPLVVVIAGPTASGKSDVAARICADRKGLIVSADSVQAYRDVQIGANKPTLEERKETPHILIDMADHTESYNAAEWKTDAVSTIQMMLDQNDVDDDNPRGASIAQSVTDARLLKGYGENEALLPVVCGGTMMYLHWLVHGQPDAMKPSEQAVEKAQATVSKFQETNDYPGALAHVSSFGEVFATRTTQFEGQDWYRLRRTLEVALTVQGEDNKEELTKQLYTGQREGSLSSLGYDVRCFFLCPDDRMDHTRIIDERCEQMIMRGLLEETTELCLSGCMPDMVTRAIGYRQTLDYLNSQGAARSEEEDFDQFLNDFSTATRRYAKKQMSWFRKDKDFTFIPVPLGAEKQERVSQAAATIQNYCQMSRLDYEGSLYAADSASAVLKQNNEGQGKKMKFYQFQRYILTAGSQEYKRAFDHAVACRQRMSAKSRRLET